MTEPTLLPPPDPAPLPPPDPAPVAPASSARQPARDVVPWLYGVGFLILAAAILYVWQYPSTPSEPAEDQTAIQVIAQHVADIDARLNNLERRPTVDISKITARLDALDGRVADQTQLGARMDTLSGRIESLAGRDQTSIDAAKQQVSAVGSRVAALEASSANVDAVTQRINRLGRLQEASLALAAGRPIGDIPDAPEGLARYAHAPPPTEAGLRLSFPSAERAALDARQPDNTEAPFLDRVWDRAQGLVTVRRGESVVVGNPAAIALGNARTAIDAGDLSGAVAAVGALTGAPAQAMSAWLADAKALLQARAALAQLATRA